jgi:protein-tyrosine phosphatase
VADLLKRLRHVPDRLLHASRRREALAALAARRPPTFVLVMCNGNLFRSPFAAAVLQRELKRSGMETVRVESAGFAVHGRPSPPHAIAAAARRGVDLMGHSSQLVIAGLARAADFIVVMDSMQHRTVCERFGRPARDVLLLGDFDPLPIQTRAIRDPVECPPAVFEEVYARIDRCVTVLAAAIKGSVGADRPVGLGLGVVQRRPPAPTRRDSL